ncbi:MAG: hypothetical protein ACOC89_04510 [Candidatus Saliniplasma sp.]
MGEEPEIGIVDRVKGYFNDKPITPSSRTDRYITENLPDYIDKYKLADRGDLKGVDKRLAEFNREVNELKEWKKSTKKRHEKVKKKVERLEKKYGLED